MIHYYPFALTVRSGPNQAIWGWANAVARLGVEVSILHHGGDPSSRDHEHVRLVEIPFRGSGRTLRPQRIDSYLSRSDLLILHSGYVGRNFVAAAAARRHGIPYLIMPHGAYAPEIRHRRSVVRPFWEIAERRMLEGALAVHCIFQLEAQHVVELAPRARTVVSPSGFDLPERSWRGGGGYLCWIGRFDVHIKGIDLLFAALARIDSAKRPMFILHGEDDRFSRRQVEELSERMGLGSSVSVRGPIYGAAKEDLLINCDGYVQPSRADVQSLALMESLALGVPTLTTSVVGTATMLAQADAALIASPEPESLADAIGVLIAGGARFGARGRALVASAFAWPRVGQDLLRQIGEHRDRSFPRGLA